MNRARFVYRISAAVEQVFAAAAFERDHPLGDGGVKKPPRLELINAGEHRARDARLPPAGMSATRARRESGKTVFPG